MAAANAAATSPSPLARSTRASPARPPEATPGASIDSSARNAIESVVVSWQFMMDEQIPDWMAGPRSLRTEKDDPGILPTFTVDSKEAGADKNGKCEAGVRASLCPAATG